MAGRGKNFDYDSDGEEDSREYVLTPSISECAKGMSDWCCRLSAEVKPLLM